MHRRPLAVRTRQLSAIGVQLNDTDLLTHRTGDLLRPIAPGEKTSGERASAAADFINQRFVAGTIQFGINQPHPGFFERG